MTKEEEKAMTAMPKIDMSKVANLEALDGATRKTVGSMAANLKESDRRKNKKRFNFQQAMTFQLPSGGRFYQDSPDEDLRNGIIKLYPFSLAEEEIITNKTYLKNGSMFRILFDTCMASDYQAEKLLQFDALYIMYVLRQISYGDDYNFTVKCDKCDEEFNYSMNISEIEWAELPEDVVDEHVITLPVSGFTVTMRLMRLGMEEAQDNIKRKYRCGDKVATLISNTTSIVDDNGEEVIPEDWGDFYEALPTLDRNTINTAFKGTKQEPKITLRCPACGEEIEFDVPISEDFFRLS
jgi:hypothetical protein